LHEYENEGDFFSDKLVQVNRDLDEGGGGKVRRTSGLKERPRATTVPWIRATARGGLSAKFTGNVRTKKDSKQFERRDGFGAAVLRVGHRKRSWKLGKRWCRAYGARCFFRTGSQPSRAGLTYAAPTVLKIVGNVNEARMKDVKRKPWDLVERKTPAGSRRYKIESAALVV